jgi:GNAT superfamily N-acetyltransferase
MTSPDQLVPGAPPPSPIDLIVAGPEAAPAVRSTYVRIWAPLSAHGRKEWSDDEWRAELSHPDARSWFAQVDGEIAGFVELSNGRNGDIGIVVFGLVPEYQGKGYGAAFLTATTQLAWTLGDPTHRVWLQTSSDDHPHALPNYQHRGFKPFSTE